MTDGPAVGRFLEVALDAPGSFQVAVVDFLIEREHHLLKGRSKSMVPTLCLQVGTGSDEVNPDEERGTEFVPVFQADDGLLYFQPWKE